MVQVLPEKAVGCKHNSHHATLPGDHQPHPAAAVPVLTATHIFWWALKIKQKEKQSQEEDLANWRDTIKQACCGGALAWSCWRSIRKLFGPWVVGIHLINLDGRSWNSQDLGNPWLCLCCAHFQHGSFLWLHLDIHLFPRSVISDFQLFVVCICIRLYNIFILCTIYSPIHHIFRYTTSIF